MKNPSPSSSEGRLTSLRLDLPPSGSPHSTSSSTQQKPSVDSFLKHLGDPGRFQIVIMVLLASNCIPVVVNHLLMAFYAVTAPHNCRVPEVYLDNKSLWLPLKQEQVDVGMPNSGVTYEECGMYLDAHNHSLGKTECVHGYEFHFEGKEWNIVAEWGLVCDRAFLAPLVTTIYFCGVMIGGVIFGSLSDRYGRKNMMLVCLYTQCLLGIAIHFVRRLIVFVGLRFIQGIFIQGLQCVTYSMVMELFSPQYRTLAGCVIEAFWASGIIMLAAIAKVVQHWRYIQLAVNIPTLATIFYIWIIPESVRWLLSRGKLSRAEDVVVRIASYNSLRLDRVWLREELSEVARAVAEDNSNASNKTPGIKDLFTHQTIRRNALVLFFVWFSVAISYYGLSYSIPNLSGDRHLNFMIGGGIELMAYLLAYVLLNAFGRKYPLVAYLFLSGALCIATVAVKRYVPESFVDVPGLSTALALIGKAAVVSCFCSIFIYSSELFPTVIRTLAVGACAFFGRVGSLLAPQILLLGRYLHADAPELVTFSTFGVLIIVAGFLTLALPETLYTALPDTVNQAERLGSVKRREGKTGSLLRRKKNSDSEERLEEVGYGKSPEWVEVDGMIVSKGALLEDRSRSETLCSSSSGGPGVGGGLGGGLAGRHGMPGPPLTAAAANTLGRGSVVSLPYSNRTLLTNSSRSTGYDPYTRAATDIAEEEPPYETLPNIDLTEEEMKVQQGRPYLHKTIGESSHYCEGLDNSNRGALLHQPGQDDSVTSGHDASAIYDFIREEPSNAKDSIKHRILFSAGDETRL